MIRTRTVRLSRKSNIALRYKESVRTVLGPPAGGGFASRRMTSMHLSEALNGVLGVIAGLAIHPD